jgi:hypothetical protein
MAVAAIASLALVGTYAALGGADYAPSPVQDPCEPREWRDPQGVEAAAEQFSLSALDGAACELRVTRETLAAALATEEARQRFAAERGIEDAELEAAVRAGVVRGIDDAEDADALSPVVAAALRQAATRLPVDEAVALIEDASAVFEDARSLIEGGRDLFERLVP